MKALLLLALALIQTPKASAADGVWYPVLTCDNGAVVIDNMTGLGRGGRGVKAQIVIHNAKIVSYFRDAGANGEYADGQYIAQGYFENATPRGNGRVEDLTNFRTEQVDVIHDDSGVTIVARGANWRFRNCSRPN